MIIVVLSSAQAILEITKKDLPDYWSRQDTAGVPMAGTRPSEPLHLASTDSVRTTYDSLAASYDQRWRRYIDRSLTRVVNALDLQGDERVLDVACGTGELEQRLFSRWPSLHVVGVDLSSNMLAQARRKHLNGDMTWLAGDASQLPVPDRSFEALVCANSFHYFRNPLDCLCEFRRVLVPNGKLVLVDWCDDYLMCKLCSIWLKWTDSAFFCTYTLTTCRELMLEAGFEVVHAERFKASWLWGMMMSVGKSP